METKAERWYYTGNEAARILGVSRTTIKTWIERGKLPAVQMGKGYQYRIPRNAVDEIIAQGERRQPDQAVTSVQPE